MRQAKAAIILLASLIWPITADAESAGSTLFNFLYLDTSARSMGMGGAYTALAAGSGALAYNPAGLASNNRNEAAFMHNQYFQDITHEHLGYASTAGWGANFDYLSFGSVRKTTISNPTGAGLGEVGLTDMAFAVGYGTKISRRLSLGGAARFVREEIAGASGQGVMFDAGFRYSLKEADVLVLAAALQNIGPKIKFNSVSEELPVLLRAGAAYAFKVYDQKAALSLDMMKGRNEDAAYKLGGEILIKGAVPLRAGVTTANDDGPGISLGTGYASENIDFDYAFVPFKDLGDTHRFSLTFRWGKGN